MLKRFAPDTATLDFRSFLDELDEAAATEPAISVDWLAALLNSNNEEQRSKGYTIQQAMDAREKIRYRKNSGSQSFNVRGSKNPNTNDSGVALERDFTTPGTPSRLGCPFSAARNRSGAPSMNGQRLASTPHSSRGSHTGRRAKRPSFHDPIQADICGDTAVSVPPSADGSAPLCPIRFLSQHGPEEVAAYFEKHKHELPRSHELCVRRYQSNEQQIRQLDAKYGNLVSMIQGLGLKHQTILPDKPDAEEAIIDEEPLPSDNIKKWAKAVSLENSVEGEQHPASHEEDRESRFDRPMKEVRVGESPSRPWGIHVPEQCPKTGRPASTRTDPTAPPIEEPPMPQPASDALRKCPIDHSKFTTFLKPDLKPSPPAEPIKNEIHPAVIELPQASEQQDDGKKTQQASMVFTGPVFIGYSMEQALQLLQQSGKGK